MSMQLILWDYRGIFFKRGGPDIFYWNSLVCLQELFTCQYQLITLAKSLDPNISLSKNLRYDQDPNSFVSSSREYFRFVFQHFVKERKVSLVISGTFSLVPRQMIKLSNSKILSETLTHFQTFLAVRGVKNTKKFAKKVFPIMLVMYPWP